MRGLDEEVGYITCERGDHDANDLALIAVSTRGTRSDLNQSDTSMDDSLPLSKFYGLGYDMDTPRPKAMDRTSHCVVELWRSSMQEVAPASLLHKEIGITDLQAKRNESIMLGCKLVKSGLRGWQYNPNHVANSQL